MNEAGGMAEKVAQKAPVANGSALQEEQIWVLREVVSIRRTELSRMPTAKEAEHAMVQLSRTRNGIRTLAAEI